VLPLVAMMFAVPCPTPVASPELLIVTTPLALEDQATEDVHPVLEPSE
jgi:hypothetical protein